jgi:hypothetical protein
MVRGKVKEVKDRKVVVTVILSAEGAVCAQGEVVAVKMPEHMMSLKGEEGTPA